MSKYRLEFNDATEFEVGHCGACVLSYVIREPFHGVKRRVCVMGYFHDECPLEEVEESDQAEWGVSDSHHYCSACYTEFDNITGFKYCPNCGVKMR